MYRKLSACVITTAFSNCSTHLLLLCSKFQSKIYTSNCKSAQTQWKTSYSVAQSTSNEFEFIFLHNTLAKWTARQRSVLISSRFFTYILQFSRSVSLDVFVIILLDQIHLLFYVPYKANTLDSHKFSFEWTLVGIRVSFRVSILVETYAKN